MALLLFAIMVFFFRSKLRDFSVDDTKFATEIEAAAQRHGLDPQLVRSVVFQESRFDRFARGKSGEIGLMQIMPSGAAAEWARRNRQRKPNATELSDPAMNLEIGCWYLAHGMKKYAAYKQGTELALARYNAGERRSERWKPTDNNGDVVSKIGIHSTRDYVEKIMARYKKYKRQVMR
jgi:soluble lytic murein transglycosylase